MRLGLEKLVKARKDAIRSDIVHLGLKTLDAYKADLNAHLPPDAHEHVNSVAPDFVGSIKGLRTVASYQNAVDTELARVQIVLSTLGNRLHANIKTIRESGLVIFDLKALLGKAPDDLAAVLAQRKALEADRQIVIAAPVHPQIQVPAPAAVNAEQAAPYDSGRLIRLGELNDLLAPISLTASGLERLGFATHAVEKNAKLYRACDFPAICAALIQHLTTLRTT